MSQRTSRPYLSDNVSEVCNEVTVMGNRGSRAKREGGKARGNDEGGGLRDEDRRIVKGRRG